MITSIYNADLCWNIMERKSDKIADQICEKLKSGNPIRMKLPGHGLFKMDRPVPFLVIYRQSKLLSDNFPVLLAKTEASYLIAQDSEECDIPFIAKTISTYLADQYRSFLILEIWLAENNSGPPFTIHINQKAAISVASKLADELNEIHIGNKQIHARLNKQKKPGCPPNHSPLLDENIARQSEVFTIGLEISPIYNDSGTGKPYPLFVRELREKFGRALRKSLFEFVRTSTSYHVTHFEMLGTTELDKKVWEIDKDLADYSNLFDFLLLTTPINVAEEWETFVDTGYRKAPIFHYRPMPIEPELIKRKIYNLPIEDISDPTISFLFRDKRKEIDRMLNMMLDREKPEFMQSSLQLFGGIDDHLLETARAILVAAQVTKDEVDDDYLDAYAFAKLAEEELTWLKKQYSSISNAVRVRDDIEGIMVSRGTLNINKKFKLPRHRALALLQHEVGTHIVTYYNGKAQPLKLFYIGVPGYEQLQEGLAVFAEYLSGGLTNERLRILAARVVAVQHMIKGNRFPDTFDMLAEKYGFDLPTAFNISMRVYRGGGLTKDAVYLKGLMNLLEYLKKGNDIAPLLIGKIRQDYIPVVNELTYRGLLAKIPIKPRYLKPPYNKLIDQIKTSGNIFSMINNSA